MAVILDSFPIRWFLPAVALVGLVTVAEAAESLRPLDLRQVNVGGVLGHRMEATIHSNLCRLDMDRDFLRPFQEKKTPAGGYIGLGKLIDALVRLAASSNDAQLSTLKKDVVAKTIAAQEPDGYLGIFAAPDRLWELWDLCEAGYGLYHYAPAESPEDLTLTLTEFPDPDGEAVYFRVADPVAPDLVDDELLALPERGAD